jgi:type IV secretory pathway TrbD component
MMGIVILIGGAFIVFASGVGLMETKNQEWYLAAGFGFLVLMVAAALFYDWGRRDEAERQRRLRAERDGER